MSIAHKAFKAGSWLALFRTISQAFSWAVTIIVARILAPEDYGLMAMATILTGYVVLFSELGLGAAIIQRKNITDEELSSLFWFVLGWGLILSITCLILAYPTVAIFNEKRIFRVTQSAALLYIISSLLIVPNNILHRELRFKAIGFIDAVAVIISCIMMLMIAKLGGGVWTLISGMIIKVFISALLTYFVLSWRPRVHFKFDEIKPYLKFGLYIAAGRTLYYLYTRSDSFFAGRLLGSTTLGYYSFALTLSSIPTNKFVTLVNNISYPVFSRYQYINERFNGFYLKIIRLVSFLMFPTYVGLFFIADQLIPLILGPKWIPIILPFKFLCISQLIISITATNGFAIQAKNRPQWNLYVNIIYTLILPASFYIAAKHGMIFLVIPWITVQPLIRLGQTWMTLRLLTISFIDYFKVFIHPAFGAITMLFVLALTKHLYFNTFNIMYRDLKLYVVVIILLGTITYSSYSIIFNRNIITSMINLIKNKS